MSLIIPLTPPQKKERFDDFMRSLHYAAHYLLTGTQKPALNNVSIKMDELSEDHIRLHLEGLSFPSEIIDKIVYDNVLYFSAFTLKNVRIIIDPESTLQANFYGAIMEDRVIMVEQMGDCTHEYDLTETDNHLTGEISWA